MLPPAHLAEEVDAGRELRLPSPGQRALLARLLAQVGPAADILHLHVEPCRPAHGRRSHGLLTE